MRDLFERATAAKPCVLFFDEFDSIAPKRHAINYRAHNILINGVLIEVMIALVLQIVLLIKCSPRWMVRRAWMACTSLLLPGEIGVNAVENMVTYATSRPDLIDSALLRPGRLDKALFCDMPSQEERKEVRIPAHSVSLSAYFSTTRS